MNIDNVFKKIAIHLFFEEYVIKDNFGNEYKTGAIGFTWLFRNLPYVLMAFFCVIILILGLTADR